MEIARLGPFQKFDGNFSPLVGDILPYLDCPAILALSQVSNDFNRAKRIEARIESDLLSFGFTPTEIKTDARKKYAFFFTHAVEMRHSRSIRNQFYWDVPGNSTA